MVSENRDRMWGALEVLFPLRQSEDDSEEFTIVDVIVSFHSREGLREVSAGVEIA